MKTAAPYLMFDGNCKEAISYYARCFGVDAKVMPTEQGDRVMHSSVQKGSFLIMASDWMEGNFQLGNNSQIYLECESQKEVDDLHASLGQGGKSTMKPDNTFWGSYFGSVTDKFGINWMMGYDTPKK